MQPLRKYAKSLLKLIIAAYLLVAMGVFSWLPVIILNFDQAHQATGQDSGNVVSWIVHHTTDDVHSQKSVNHDAHHATILHETPDHLLKLPSDDFIKYMLKVALQFEMITVMSALILLWVFFTLLRDIIPKCIGILPIFDTPVRNTITILTRTVVLRH
jgi:hypothetical protein